MSTQPTATSTESTKHKPFVPVNMEMKEFTLRALLIGLVMCVVLGAANAYLGLRAGITIAATYPAAVIGMAILRSWKGSVLEENIARTAGSIGESVAAGAIFTIPAFLLAGAWKSFRPEDAYWKSTALITVGSILGVLFISLVRRVMVEDPELPFPESVAASEIHKAGQRGAKAESICSGISGSADWFTCWAASVCSRRTMTFIFQLGRWEKVRCDLARQQMQMHWSQGAPAYLRVQA